MSREVQGMFAKIARRYDLANDVLSLGIHRWWRDRAVRSADIKVGQRVLDLCTGTGDQAFALARVVGQSGMVAGLDFVPDMLALAEQKSATRLNGNGAHPHFLPRQCRNRARLGRRSPNRLEARTPASEAVSQETDR